MLGMQVEYELGKLIQQKKALTLIT